MAQARLKINTSSATKTAGGDVRGGGLRGANDFEDSPPLMPIASEADIDYSLVYALHTFVANLEGQVCVLKGDSLELLDDSNSYWWLVKCIKTQEIGYIPAENVETPIERLARLNGQRNIDHTSSNDVDRRNRGLVPHKKPQRIQFSELPPEVFEESDSDGEGDYGDEYSADDDPRYEYDYNPDDEVVSSSLLSMDSLSRGWKNPLASKGIPHSTSPESSNGGIKQNLWGKLFKKREGERSFGSFSLSSASTSPKLFGNLEDLSISSGGQGQSLSLSPGTPGKARFQDREITVAPRGSSARQNAGFDATVNKNSRDTTVQKQNTINVLRIFAGNVDLDATFKSVAFTESMVASVLIDGALKKFRVPDAKPSDYYLSVLYMDSQRQIADTEIVFRVLQSLQQKHLPGVGDFSKVSQSFGFRGNISTVRITDDKVIRVLINKKPQEVLDGPLRPMRIAYHDPLSQKKVYRTIGIPRGAKAEDAIDIALQSFGMHTSLGTEYILCSMLNNQETVLLSGEPLIPIMRVAEQRGQELSFLLRQDKPTLHSSQGNSSPPTRSAQSAFQPVTSDNLSQDYISAESVDSKVDYGQTRKTGISNSEMPGLVLLSERKNPSPIPTRGTSNSDKALGGVSALSGSAQNRAPPPINSLASNGLPIAPSNSNNSSARVMNTLDWIHASLDRRIAVAGSDKTSPLRTANGTVAELSPSHAFAGNSKSTFDAAMNSSGKSEPFQKSTTVSSFNDSSSSDRLNYFGSMVEYLDETLKEDSDERRLQQMERDLDIDPHKKRTSAVDRLKRRSQLHTIAPKSSISSSNPLQRNSNLPPHINRALSRSNGGADSFTFGSPPLRDVLDDLEADIESILRKNMERDSSRRRSSRMSSNVMTLNKARASIANDSKNHKLPPMVSLYSVDTHNSKDDTDIIDSLFITFKGD
ncbi:hypothetical protein BSLG_002147 [Batrachochytrium salamandrivorans]|nr:hypothetical protein BSLG_002147 [Batrachochytrium salamandrivorans]